MNANFENWYVQGLQAIVSADEAGAKATERGADYTKAGNIEELAKSSADLQKKNAETVRQLLSSVGEQPSGRPNPSMDGIIRASEEMIENADADSKDAAGLAAGQLALHYYIAAYGSLASTAKHLGRTEDAQAIKRMLDAVKAQDERYTQAAERQANPAAS